MQNEKIALVTGAGRGIGRQIALKLAEQGITVIVNYNGSEEAAESVVNKITESGGRAKAVKCNVSDYKETEEMIASIVKEFGRLDILVNNAGITADNLMVRMTEEDFDKVININLKGAFNTIKHVNRQMIKQRYGRIVNISSVVGVTGNAGQANYAASKAGIIGLTKSAARELASRNVTVNAVAPGFIQTEMTDKLPENVKEQMQSQIPLKRLGTTEDIAAAVSFLVSEDASYITGQVIEVNGGMNM
ncbi:MAG: 3-oxoacyl-[acyl-carrier-protein] reductase [Lachnospiraceae bacterium]|nr:3-oxoacyl-[acyl-carrier-protein] reductase [Lachnospiraceae bacterium]MDE5781590.1 3-oxoacyl-[acyl-carrier-protein] reductase [Lachnospiraceae bacterium]